MRLLNVYNLSFATFNEGEIPPYAIASHRWGEEEVTYLEVSEKRNEWKKAFKKIRGFCHLTRTRNNLVERTLKPKVRPACGNPASGRAVRTDWIWIDTCCIDATSSADVAENINSMYKYYERAEECYAYLPDVKTSKEFGGSSWFTRGWTLQELIAPRLVFFFSRQWKILGHKCCYSHLLNPSSYECGWGDQRLVYEIFSVTGIPDEVLRKQKTQFNLATILEWMRNRETTKIEDMAYCLLGLLQVFMVPNYGEGLHAWIRLEDEVCKKNCCRCLYSSTPTRVGNALRHHDFGQSEMTARNQFARGPFGHDNHCYTLSSGDNGGGGSGGGAWYSLADLKARKGSGRATASNNDHSNRNKYERPPYAARAAQWRDEFLIAYPGACRNGSSRGDTPPRSKLEDPKPLNLFARWSIS